MQKGAGLPRPGSLVASLAVASLAVAAVSGCTAHDWRVLKVLTHHGASRCRRASRVTRSDQRSRRASRCRDAATLNDRILTRTRTVTHSIFLGRGASCGGWYPAAHLRTTTAQDVRAAGSKYSTPVTVLSLESTSCCSTWRDNTPLQKSAARRVTPARGDRVFAVHDDPSLPACPVPSCAHRHSPLALRPPSLNTSPRRPRRSGSHPRRRSCSG